MSPVFSTTTPYVMGVAQVVGRVPLCRKNGKGRHGTQSCAGSPTTSNSVSPQAHPPPPRQLFTTVTSFHRQCPLPPHIVPGVEATHTVVAQLIHSNIKGTIIHCPGERKITHGGVNLEVTNRTHGVAMGKKKVGTGGRHALWYNHTKVLEHRRESYAAYTLIGRIETAWQVE